MARPFRDLPRFIDAIRDSIPDAAAAAKGKALKVIGRGVVYDTPVDTGLHRSNWVATTGTPFAGVRPAYAPGQKLGKGERANASAAIAQITRVANVSVFQVQYDVPLYLTNNAPAIGELNAGRSPQAPPSFIQRDIKAAHRVTATEMAATLRAGLHKRGF